MKSILTLLLCCIVTFSFAQTEKNTNADDIYGNSRKSLVQVDQPKINLNLPGNHLKKAANSLSGAVLFGILTGVAMSVLAKNDNPDISRYVGIGGGLITTGLFVTSASHLSKAGEELNKVLQEQSKK